MKSPKTLACLFCHQNVKFNQKDNDTYLSHLKLEHNINFCQNFLLMVNLMDKKRLREFLSKFNETYKGEEENDEDIVQNACVDYVEDETDKFGQESKKGGREEIHDEETSFNSFYKELILEFNSETSDDFENGDINFEEKEMDFLSKIKQKPMVSFSDSVEIIQECKPDAQNGFDSVAAQKDNSEDLVASETNIRASLDHEMEYQEFEEDLMIGNASMNYNEPQDTSDDTIDDKLQFSGQDNIEVIDEAIEAVEEEWDHISEMENEYEINYNNIYSEPTVTNKQKTLSSHRNCTICSILYIKSIISKRVKSLVI